MFHNLVFLLVLLTVLGPAACCHDSKIDFLQIPKRNIYDAYCERLVSHINEVRIIKLCDPIPRGWRIMTFEEGKCMKPQLESIMCGWSIVAFDHGKLDGPNYGQKFSCSYGPECGEKFIVRKQRCDFD